MDSKDLTWFQKVCECRSITKAAASLYITPQGLSRGIKSLEAEMGVTLLERTPNGISLTPYGETLYKHSGILLKDFKAAVSELEMLKQQERGLLRICSAYGVFRVLGVDFILDFEKKNPEINLDYAEYPDEYIERELLEDHYDVGFAVGPIQSEEMVSLPLFHSSVSLLVYEGHPLYEREQVTFPDLEGENLILESRAFKINSLVKESCRQAGFDPNIIFCTSGFSLCHKLTAQKRGISVVVDLIGKDMSAQGIRAIPIADSFDWAVYLIYRQRYQNYRHIRQWRDYTEHFLDCSSSL